MSIALVISEAVAMGLTGGGNSETNWLADFQTTNLDRSFYVLVR